MTDDERLNILKTDFNINLNVYDTSIITILFTE